MKAFIFLASMFITITACAQTSAPQKVTEGFSKKFGGIESVSWDQNSSNNYVASFTNNDDIDVEAVFTKEGECIETVSYLNDKDIPAAAQKDMDKNYEDYYIESVMKIEKKGAEMYYQVSIYVGDDSIVLKYKANGTRM